MTIQINGTSGISGVDGSAGTPALQGSDSNTGISFGADTVNINTGGTTRATVDSSGRVLVGTSSTVRDSRLCVRGNAAGTFTGDLELGAAAGFASIASGNSIGVLRFTESTNGGIFAQIYTEADATPGNNDYPGRIVLATTADGASSPSERMRIRADGTTVTTGTTILFGGSGTAGTPRSIAFGSNEIAWTGVGSGGTNMFLNLCDSAGNNGSNYALVFRGLASTGAVPATLSSVSFDCTSFTANGIYNQSTVAGANVHVSSGGTLYRSTSSIKFKADVETIEDIYSDALLQCRPVWYRSTAIGDAAHPDWGYWGFIAEEVAKIDPRLVFWKTHETTTDIDGNITTEECAEPVPEGVQYDRFVPHLLNLIKRQKEQIESQGAAIAALETRLTALEGGAAQ